MKKLRIALLYGGVSHEREVSIKTAEKIYEALGKRHSILRYDTKHELKKFIDDAHKKKFDIVFPALHGNFGEDGRMQGLLDSLGLAYVFSGVLASSISMNKKMTKLVAKEISIPVSEDFLLLKDQKISYQKIIDTLGFPIVIKPVESGSSFGVSIVENKSQLRRGIEHAFTVDRSALLERFIQGRELTVTVFGNEQKAKAWPVIEIIPQTSKWFDFQAKYEAGGSLEVCPARIPAKIAAIARKYALDIHRSIGCHDLSRSDFIWNEKNGKVYFLEINTIPGMTATSLAPQAAKAMGIEFTDFLEQLIAGALDRKKTRK